MPIIQNKAYFEVKIQANGLWGIGLATRKIDLNKIPLGNDSEAWILRNDSGIYHNNSLKIKTCYEKKNFRSHFKFSFPAN